MRTIEECIADLKEEYYYSNPYNEPPKDYEYKDIGKILDEILEIHKTEKELIVKELEKNYRQVEELYDKFGGKYAKGMREGIYCAIEIVKRGGKE